MTRHWLAFVAATALGAAAAPVFGQGAPPPPPPGAYPAAPGTWADPQRPHYPGPDAAPGAPYAHPLPPGAYPGEPLPYPPGPYPEPGHYRAPGPMVWHGEGAPPPVYGDPYGPAAAPCGCPGYGVPVMWVRVPIHTRYSYSPAIRHESDVVESRVVDRVVTRSVPVRREGKYIKTAPAKVTKSTKARRTK